jgi:transcriptional regulator with XRE-family HTH domain
MEPMRSRRNGTQGEMTGLGGTMTKRPQDGRRKELGQFLRSRRERSKPSQALLDRHPRRRTPGLRREEVAEEAGIGITWYTWLEQGRDIGVSPEVLRRLSRALSLSREETKHLFRLSGVGLVEDVPPLPSIVKPSLQRVLDAMEYIPAYVHNARWDRIAWNDAALALMGDFSSDPLEQRNTVWRTFLSPDVRAYTEDWDHFGVQCQRRATVRRSLADGIRRPAFRAVSGVQSTMEESGSPSQNRGNHTDPT